MEIDLYQQISNVDYSRRVCDIKLWLCESIDFVMKSSYLVK